MSLPSLIPCFSERRVLVLGDLILDHYVRGSVSRTSPEAPVPILNVEDEEYLLGGAANVAANLVSLGARVELAGLLGKDEAADVFFHVLEDQQGISPLIVQDPSRPTILKTRCVAQGQQMLRLDRERAHPMQLEIELAMLQEVLPLVEQCDGVVFSDYGKGFLTASFMAAVIKHAHKKGKAALVDPKGRDYARYRGATLITPNQKEASDASGLAIEDNESCAQAAAALQEMVQGEAIVITRGPGGVSVFPREGPPSHLPARAREVYDVTGAGDSFIATLALGLFSGGTLEQAAELGNLAGGFVVGRAGVATVTQRDLEETLDASGATPPRKQRTVGELEQICRSLRQNGSTVVFTNGFFDLLHYGHVRLLEEARGMGNALVVAINSDESTRRLKGPPRPVLSAEERARILGALPFVDYVVIFDDDTPERLLEQLRPDVLVKGTLPGDAHPHAVGQEIVRAHGGNVRFVEIEGNTISTLLERVRHREEHQS